MQGHGKIAETPNCEYHFEYGTSVMRFDADFIDGQVKLTLTDIESNAILMPMDEIGRFYNFLRSLIKENKRVVSKLPTRL